MAKGLRKPLYCNQQKVLLLSSYTVIVNTVIKISLVYNLVQFIVWSKLLFGPVIDLKFGKKTFYDLLIWFNHAWLLSQTTRNKIRYQEFFEILQWVHCCLLRYGSNSLIIQCVVLFYYLFIIIIYIIINLFFFSSP